MRAVAAFEVALELVPLAGTRTLSALRKLDAHLGGDRLAHDNVLSDC
jgi:hypothetical protein